jgi:hypothetical protein
MAYYVREPLRRPLSSHIDYGELFPPDILASNIDFIIERHSEFLVIEFKGRNEKLTRGQEILLSNLSKLPEFTVLVAIKDGEAFKMPTMIKIANDNEELIQFIRNWKMVRGL